MSGYYETRLPCPLCGSNVMVESDGVWSCQGCGGDRYNGFDYPEASTAHVEMERQHRFLEDCERRLAEPRRIGAVELDVHPLGLMVCETCGNGAPWLAVGRIARNGKLGGKVLCSHCGRSNPMRILSRSQLDPTGLPVLSDCSNCDGTGCESCSYKCGYRSCDSYAVEIHHYMPQALARDHGIDAWEWPMGPLCPEHHRLWHRIVTPNLNRKNAS